MEWKGTGIAWEGLGYELEPDSRLFTQFYHWNVKWYWPNS